jgi:hypothetical protein
LIGLLGSSNKIPVLTPSDDHLAAIVLVRMLWKFGSFAESGGQIKVVNAEMIERHAHDIILRQERRVFNRYRILPGNLPLTGTTPA